MVHHDCYENGTIGTNCTSKILLLTQMAITSLCITINNAMELQGTSERNNSQLDESRNCINLLLNNRV